MHMVQIPDTIFFRYIHRLVPVSGTCTANLPEIQALCRHTFQDFFEGHGDSKFKVVQPSFDILSRTQTVPVQN
jgi:hypothetical protein